MLAKMRCVRHVPGTNFGIPWGNASYWLMQPGDRNSAVPGGRMLAKVRCFRHVPGTKFSCTSSLGLFNQRSYPSWLECYSYRSLFSAVIDSLDKQTNQSGLFGNFERLPQCVEFR